MLTHEMVPPRKPTPDPTTGFHCLVLHGLGDSASGWRPAAPYFALDSMGWIFANAPLPYHDGFSWFDIPQDFAIDLAQVRRSRAMLSELIAHLLIELEIPSEQLFLLGFSQGCLMVVDAALRQPRRFAGVVGISGFLVGLQDFPAAFGPHALAQPILMTHGLYDPMIPIDFVRGQKDDLQRLGLHLDWKEYPKEHSLDPQREIGDISAWMRGKMSLVSK